jgi:RimJ/RimL family protein N-acetyltransferase
VGLGRATTVVSLVKAAAFENDPGAATYQASHLAVFPASAGLERRVFHRLEHFERFATFLAAILVGRHE